MATASPGQLGSGRRAAEAFPQDGLVQSDSDPRALFAALLRLAEGDDEVGAWTLQRWREAAEASRIVYELARCSGNRSAAARRLGIARRTLYSKMERLRING
ncbi:MAG: helix-turn-helix domain-containing protein [Myxococcota bacterium]